MRKIINGKMYDTDTAQEIASYDNSVTQEDLNYYHVQLFKTKNETYFLYEETYNYEDIELISEEEAREWCEIRVTPDEYEEIFGAVEEG